MGDFIPTTSGCARVLTVDEMSTLDWGEGWSTAVKERRYYEVVAETLHGPFDCRFLVLEDGAGEVCGIQPFFFVEQDLIAAAPMLLRSLVARVRRFAPRFLRLKMLMVGCAAGEGHIGGANDAERDWLVSATADALPSVARRGGAALIVWKDFPHSFRSLLDAKLAAYARLPSMPSTRLRLDFTDFEDYLQRHLSHATRKDLRRKFRAAADAQISMTVQSSLADVIDEAFPLYEQVLARSPLQFERLTKEFFLRISERMPERIRYFLWRCEGRLVAFSLCLVHEDEIHDEYLGLDYTVALELHLYFVTLRDVLGWATAQGLRTYYSTPLNYRPKRQLGFELTPLDLYVRHLNPVANTLLRLALPWIQPTRAEPVLREFPNAAEL